MLNPNHKINNFGFRRTKKMEKIMETEKEFADSKSYRAAQKAIQHKGIEDATHESIRMIGLLLDFEENLSPVIEKKLREILKSLVVIRHKNRTIQEHNP